MNSHPYGAATPPVTQDEEEDPRIVEVSLEFQKLLEVDFAVI